jgi:threonine dehydratase
MRGSPLSDLVSLEEILRTRNSLPRILRRTPIVPFPSPHLERNGELFLKAENLQITGAYKPRAAFARVAALSGTALERGIVITSSGNFAQAFALAARLAGTRVVCVMLDRTSPYKVEAARALGAEVVFCGTDAAGRQRFVEDVAKERGMVAIDTWEDRELIAGHASIGLEILEDMPDVTTVLVPVSSGGGAAGIATAIKENRPEVRVIGVQPSGANAAYLSRRAGRLVTLEHWDSIADGLSAVRPGGFPFAHLERYLDDIVLVSDADIARALVTLLVKCKLLVEPAGATAAAAYLSGTVQSKGPTLALVTGGNVTSGRLQSFLANSEPHP